MRSSGRASITGEAMIPHRFLRRSRVQEWPPRGRTTSAGMRAADGDATTDRRWLLYGATGYTGRLIARMAVQRGLRPTLAGRNLGKVEVLAAELGLESRVAALEDPAAGDALPSGVPVVLHCAGPFIHPFRPMVEACLRTGTHYLDITGEHPVFEALAARDGEARAAGIMVLPGAGFGVVPSDCLAAHLKRRLPSATHLPLAPPRPPRPARDPAPRGGRIRRAGVLTRVPLAGKTRLIDFGDGPVPAVTIPWGDVSTAYYSTGIPNIEVYSVLPRELRRLMVAGRYMSWLLRVPGVRRLGRRALMPRPPRPTDAERARGMSLLWGEAVDAPGRRVISRMRGPDGYTFTALAALAIVGRVLAGQAPAGFQTPAKAFGTDFVLEIEGVVGEDVR